MSQMALESLRLVQKEFQKRLQGKDIERYVAVNYLQKIEGRVHDQKDTTWVKAWTYMLAGLHKNVLETVSQKHKNYSEFMNGYASVSESLNNAHP